MGEVVRLRKAEEESKEAARVNALLLAERYARMGDEAREGYERALLLCDRLGLSYAEIARQTGKQESAIRMYLNRKRGTRNGR